MIIRADNTLKPLLGIEVVLHCDSHDGNLFQSKRHSKMKLRVCVITLLALYACLADVL